MSGLVKICGLGAHPPEETTLETLQELEDCRVVFSDLADARVFAWLKGYCRRLRRPRDAAEVAAQAARGGSVGLAVWGHPNFSSRLARRLQRECQARGVAFKVFGAISPVGSAFARSGSFLGGDYGYQGLQAYELETFLDRPEALNPGLPAVLYAEFAPPSRWEEAVSRLRGRFPPDHPVSLYPVGSRQGEDLLLAGLESRKLQGAVLLLPPLRPISPSS